MQKMPFFTGAFAAALIFGALPLCAQPPAPQRRREPMGPPKNLQVLPKNISHDDLIKTMHGFTGGLGVKCTSRRCMDLREGWESSAPSVTSWTVSRTT